MQDIETTVLGVTGRKTRSQRDIFDVALGDGNTYTTFKQPLANKANALTGQAVTARVSVTQNGDYTNFNLEDIAPQGQLVPMAAPAGTAVPAGTPIAAPAAIPMQQEGGGGRRDMSPEREARIHRQSAYAAASTFIGHVYSGAGPEALPEAASDLRRLTEEFAQFAATGAWFPHSAGEVAAQVNEQAGAEAVSVGTKEIIPW